MQRFYKW